MQRGITGCVKWPRHLGPVVALSLWLGSSLAILAPAVRAVEVVRMARNGIEQELSGQVLVEAVDGGILLQGDDGRLWVLQPKEIISRSDDEGDFKPLDSKTISQRLLQEMPPGFKIHRTKNYVICHNTSDRYVRWVGGLFEQLHRGYYYFWQNKGWKPERPEFPLVALVFNSKDAFDHYASPEIGDRVDSIIGYYNVLTNRITTYEIPNPERNVATVVHEATHQLAYNSGLQTRLADNPFWVSEGLAIFFESPDLTANSGWQGIGRVNMPNMAQFQEYVRRRPIDSLQTLIDDDRRFKDPGLIPDAYAEAWALNYFLLRTRPEQYLNLLRDLSQGRPLLPSDSLQREQQFRKHLGDLATLDREFMDYMQTVK
jgi:hypothetical protein